MCQPEEPPNPSKPSDYQAKTGASLKLFELNSEIILEIHTKQIVFTLDFRFQFKNNTLLKRKQKNKHFICKKKNKQKGYIFLKWDKT